MLYLVLLVGMLALLPLLLVGYAGWRMGQLPSNNPAQILATDGVPTDRPVLVCFGDSLTQGGLGFDGRLGHE